MKTVLITGVSRGLGHAIATAFAAREFETIGIARSPCEVEGVRTVQLDVTDEPTVISFVESLENLDVVVNNAGIARTIVHLAELPAEMDVQEMLVQPMLI